MLSAKLTASDVPNADVVVLLTDAQGSLLGAEAVLADPLAKAVAQAARAIAADQRVVLPGAVADRRGIVVVVPCADPADAESVRRAVGEALLSHTSGGAVAVVTPSAQPDLVAAVVSGARLGAYRFDRYRSAATITRLSVIVPGISRTVPAALRRAAAEADAISDGVEWARNLVNTAPNDLGPAEFVEAARDCVGSLPVALKVWDDRALRRGGFGGLTAVGQGSARGPRLVRLTYRPAKAERHVALVGKGITFDSGGLSLKPAKAMEWMKADMGGAAAVLAAVQVAAALALPVAVTGWLALAENMPSGTAQRPGDVITIRGGTTVEVLNTDAEGRLVLADAMVEAAKESPDVMIDIATLTGAQLVALGSRVAGVMGNDDATIEAVVAASRAAGESTWPMPLPQELRASLDSPIADLANIGDRNGGMLTAALFLREFVASELPWVHLDIAGPAFNEGAPHDYTPKGGTGFGVRTLVSYLRRT